MDKTPTRSPIMIGSAVLLGMAACFAVLFAFFTKVLICQGDGGSECRTGLMTFQALVALGGLLPASALLWASVRGKRGLALFFLASLILTYLTWGILNDAAVHGWNDLKVF